MADLPYLIERTGSDLPKTELFYKIMEGVGCRMCSCWAGVYGFWKDFTFVSARTKGRRTPASQPETFLRPPGATSCRLNFLAALSPRPFKIAPVLQGVVPSFLVVARQCLFEPVPCLPDCARDPRVLPTESHGPRSAGGTFASLRPLPAATAWDLPLSNLLAPPLH
jgi:hypothetical protein